MAENSIPLTEHLEELRRRIIYCIVAVVALSITLYFFSDRIIQILARPIGTLYFFTPTEAFVARIKVSIATAVALALPFIVYQVWSFVTPALTKSERRYAFPIVVSSSILFVTGVAFAYFVVIPVGIRFLLAFASIDLQPLIGITKYLGFIVWLMLILGVVFQLPVVIFFLDRIGVVSPKGLKKKRKHVVVGVFLISALLTPPDVITQVAMSVPIILLYEASILMVSLSHRRASSGTEGGES